MVSKFEEMVYTGSVGQELLAAHSYMNGPAAQDNHTIHGCYGVQGVEQGHLPAVPEACASGQHVVQWNDLDVGRVAPVDRN